MKLLSNWRRVLRRAWSMRLMLLAGLLTGCEAVITAVGVENVPMLRDVPASARALLILLVIGGAFVARLVAQKEMDDDA